MPSGSSRDRACDALEAVREALARLAGRFGSRPGLVPIPARVATPAQRRQAALESLRQQRDQRRA